MAHRRVAGTDIPPNKLLIGPGQRILTSHILPLVSSGLHSVQVLAKPRIGIWSTGSEFVPGTCHRATDVNGPYLTAICEEFGADASFLGYLDDKRDELSREFRQVAESGNFDVLLTTGAVSAASMTLFETR
ncbi:molybdopterin biosynthesis protein [Metarhizium guizhouense ARSEF 977]|uniref:Molybdopterin biosynthesis protein n=1 Tax=Metarhizium guizhouense (strain ARSEF 977) TaxID=1276136 RepID=A0A0B4H8H0_METGA|nr:molybdopterin biosynthesis protein [Metarhizium guizhouense ARSEF 977]